MKLDVRVMSKSMMSLSNLSRKWGPHIPRIPEASVGVDGAVRCGAESARSLVLSIPYSYTSEGAGQVYTSSKLPVVVSHESWHTLPAADFGAKTNFRYPPGHTCSSTGPPCSHVFKPYTKNLSLVPIFSPNV